MRRDAAGGATHPHRFKPKFARSEAAALASAYSFRDDSLALDAGRAIARGECTLEHLQTIFRWKTKDRGRTRLLRNSDIEINDALNLAVDAETPRAAIAVLIGLCGVGIPVASAIMTAVYPDRYTIIDFRALHSLSVHSYNCTVDFYLDYLRFCQSLSIEWHMSLRNLDRALWQWSSIHAVERIDR